MAPFRIFTVLLSWLHSSIAGLVPTRRDGNYYRTRTRRQSHDRSPCLRKTSKNLIQTENIACFSDTGPGCKSAVFFPIAISCVGFFSSAAFPQSCQDHAFLEIIDQRLRDNVKWRMIRSGSILQFYNTGTLKDPGRLVHPKRVGSLSAIF